LETDRFMSLTGELVVFVIDLGFDWIQCGFLRIPLPYLTPCKGITVKYRSLLLSNILFIIQSHCSGVSHRSETVHVCREGQKAGKLNSPRLITGDQICVSSHVTFNPVFWVSFLPASDMIQHFCFAFLKGKHVFEYFSVFFFVVCVVVLLGYKHYRVSSRWIIMNVEHW
jgi:hypothetical protein